MRRFILLAVLALAPLVQTAHVAQATTFTFTTIDVPGASDTVVTGINPSGQIVGYYNDGSGAQHGFLDDQGVFTAIDVPGAAFTAAFGINARSQIVGSYADSTFGPSHGFLDDQGVFTTIDFPGADYTEAAYGINSRGQIVGAYVSAGSCHGFLDDRGIFTTIDVPDAIFGEACLGTFATGINSVTHRGEIVGYYSNEEAGGQHGFLDKGNEFSAIDFPGAAITTASGINARSQIVGSYLDSSSNQHGFLDDQGVFTTIDFPGASPSPIGGTTAFGINDSGQIVGFYNAPGGPQGFLTAHGFRATSNIRPCRRSDGDSPPDCGEAQP